MSASRTSKPRWLAHPLLSLLLALVWLLLQQSLALPNLLTAAVIGLLLPRWLLGFLGPATRPRGPLAMLRFAGVVLWDIVVSNLTVARLVLNPWSKPQPAWVPVPLQLRHPLGLSLLATIITTTPGTVSCIVDEEAASLLVHALDCADPEAMAQDIKTRYEAPLRAFFDGDQAA